MVDGSIRVLLVDDHVILRQGLREILEVEPDMIVVGEAGDSEQAIAQTASCRPDVVVLDVGIPGDNVTNTLRRMRDVRPQVSVLVLSVYDEPVIIRELITQGLRGYLVKSVTREEFVAAVREVHHDPDTVVLGISHESLRQVHQPGPGLLSPRERQVMAMVAQALSNSQIAHRLDITEGTVKRHLRNIFAKLDAVSRVDAINKAAMTSQLPAQTVQSGRRRIPRRPAGTVE
jgi:DNA-binding NarL/FixJ family response regulator